MNNKSWRCYAASLGGCKGSMSREHFVSKNLLKEFETNGKLETRGYPLGKSVSNSLLSAESLSAKVLCQEHNSRLADIDTAGGRFILAFFAAQQNLLEEKLPADVIYEFDGLLIERWMLKYACGFIASGNASIGTERLYKDPPALPFLQVLFGLETLPEDWGLYTKAAAPIGITGGELGFALYTPMHEKGSRILAGVRMLHNGFDSTLALISPQKPIKGELEGAIHHPEYFNFLHQPTGRSATISLNWPHPIRGLGFEMPLHKGDR